MPAMDTYKHLNEDDGVTVDVEEIARQVVRLNYGTHRMLSALVRARRELATPAALRGDPDELADSLEDLLNKGMF